MKRFQLDGLSFTNRRYFIYDWTHPQAVGSDLGYHYISLDDNNQLAAAQTDPVGFVAALPDKTILDEIQRAPGLFTSLKASVAKSPATNQPFWSNCFRVIFYVRLALES